MVESNAPFEAFSADGDDVTWTTWDGDHAESLALRWENEAWTATGHVGRENVQYVMRLSATYEARAFGIHSAMPTIARFSLRLTKPSGTRLDPPTQAHFSSRRSI